MATKRVKAKSSKQKDDFKSFYGNFSPSEASFGKDGRGGNRAARENRLNNIESTSIQREKEIELLEKADVERIANNNSFIEQGNADIEARKKTDLNNEQKWAENRETRQGNIENRKIREDLAYAEADKARIAENNAWLDKGVESKLQKKEKAYDNEQKWIEARETRRKNVEKREGKFRINDIDEARDFAYIENRNRRLGSPVEERIEDKIRERSADRIRDKRLNAINSKERSKARKLFEKTIGEPTYVDLPDRPVPSTFEQRAAAVTGRSEESINKGIKKSEKNLKKRGIPTESALRTKIAQQKIAAGTAEAVTEAAGKAVTEEAGKAVTEAAGKAVKSNADSIAKGISKTKIARIGAAVGVGALVVSNMSKNKGQQPNGQLYGQQTPYGY